MRLNYIDNIDCLEGLAAVPDNSVDLIVCDLPYGVTDCKWDKVIPFEDMWTAFHRVMKVKGVCVLFGQQPFMSKLVASNYSDFSHCWYWKKNTATGFLNAKKMPLKNVEEIAVFVLNVPSKNNEGLHQDLRQYFFDELAKTGKTRPEINKLLGSQMASHYFTWGQQFSIPTPAAYKKLQDLTGCFPRSYETIKAEWDATLAEEEQAPYTYNPQGTEACSIQKKARTHDTIYDIDQSEGYEQTTTNYPRQLLEYSVPNSMDRVHPTQKPTELVEYLIKTYSNPGEVVLDACMGSGTTAVACIRTGRNYIGFELDEKYHAIAQGRIADAVDELLMAELV